MFTPLSTLAIQRGSLSSRADANLASVIAPSLIVELGRPPSPVPRSCVMGGGGGFAPINWPAGWKCLPTLFWRSLACLIAAWLCRFAALF